MPTNNPIIKIFFKRIFRNRLQFSPRILFCVFYRLKTGASKFDDICWVFGQKFDWVFEENSDLSERVEQQRVSCPNSRLKWYELIRETQKFRRLSLLNLNDDFQPRFSVEDVDGRPERGKSSTRFRPLLILQT